VDSNYPALCQYRKDLKPENFLLGTGQGNMVYMTDLGLAIYRRPQHLSSSSAAAHGHPPRSPQLLGTFRYASINGHLGIGGWRANYTEAGGQIS
jgi:serine/threonine protein kinase